jgi:hypothetical protein
LSQKPKYLCNYVTRVKVYTSNVNRRILVKEPLRRANEGTSDRFHAGIEMFPRIAAKDNITSAIPDNGRMRPIFVVCEMNRPPIPSDDR